MRKENEPNTAALSEEEKARNRRSALLKLGAMVLFLLIVLAFATAAWFAMNREATATGMGVTIGSDGFELAVEDNANGIGYQSLYSRFSSLFSGFGTNETTSTGVSGSTIRWRLTTEDKALQPGSEGVLRFRVTPNKTLRYSLHFDAYTAESIIETDANRQPVTDPDTNLPVEYVTSMAEVDPTGPAEEWEGVTYLHSHILFFTGRTADTTKISGKTLYRYHGWISDPSSFTMTPDANGWVEIYWIWPNTFGQLVLDDTADSTAFPYLTRTVSVLDATGETQDRAALNAYIGNPDKHMFAGSAGENTTYAQLLAEFNANKAPGTTYDKLSEGYNAADQIIGKNLDYVMLRLTASAS